MSDTDRKLAVFPAFHKVDGRRVVVVGGGPEAAAKIRLLAETKAEIVVFAGALDKETGADLIAAHADWRGAWPSVADLAGAALVFAATGSEEGDREIWALATAGRRSGQRRRPARALRFLHAGDRQPRAARGRDRQRRRRAGAVAPCPRPDRGAARAGLRRSRRPRRAAPRARGAGASPRAPTAAASGRASSPARSPRRSSPAQLDEAEARGAPHCSRSTEPFAGHVSLVGAGPGAEDLLTLRAQRALQEADVIVYDRLVPEAIVAQGRRDARRIYVGKAKGDHSLSARTRSTRSSSREAQAGHRVVRLKSGDPLIFGRAGEEMAALRAAGVSFDVVPGITAAFAAAAETEIPLTLRDVVLGAGLRHRPRCRRRDAAGLGGPGALRRDRRGLYGPHRRRQGRRAADRGGPRAHRRRSP